MHSNLSEDSLWEYVKEADENDYVMCCGIKGDAEEESGLVSQHVYTLIDAYELEGHKLLKI